MPDLSAELDQSLIASLTCPVCGCALHTSDDRRSLVCDGARTHCFDGGGGGYLPLAPRHPGGGDARDAVRARSHFLNSGYYEPARAALCRLAAEHFPSGGCLLDAGCGEGYYSIGLAASGFAVMGFDLSKYAVDAAARRARAERLRKAPRDGSHTLFAVGSVFELPVRDACVDGVVNVFAPCAPAEFARVLKSGGKLIVAGAGEEHLMGLKRLLYDETHVNDSRRDLPGADVPLTLSERRTVSFSMTVEGRENLDALFSMTPYYWRTSRDGQERLAAADRLETSVSFDFFVYTKTVDE